MDVDRDITVVLDVCSVSVVNHNGASHPQAGVWVWRSQDEPLRWALGGPAEGDLLTRLSAGAPQLGPGQQPPGPPGFPCDKKEAVIRSINPVRAPLADHNAATGVSRRAVAAVVQGWSSR